MTVEVSDDAKPVAFLAMVVVFALLVAFRLALIGVGFVVRALPNTETV